MNSILHTYPCYVNTKLHYDKIIDHIIRDVDKESHSSDLIKKLYLEAFDINTDHFNIFRSAVNNTNNPICSMITFVDDGYSENNIPPEGTTMDYVGLLYADVIPKKFIINDNYKEEYIRKVFNTIIEIVKLDILYKDDCFAQKNPYSLLLRLLPFYKTYHHIKTSRISILDTDLFNAILCENNIVCNEDDASLILRSLDTSGWYTDEPWRIYNIMTCNNSIKVLRG